MTFKLNNAAHLVKAARSFSGEPTVYEYASLDEMPPDHRAKVEHLIEPGKTPTRITLRLYENPKSENQLKEVFETMLRRFYGGSRDLFRAAVGAQEIDTVELGPWEGRGLSPDELAAALAEAFTEAGL